MNSSLYFSWRYLVTRRKEKFISLISVIAVLGIAIGVMALIVVIAVMSGFDNDLRDKIVGNYSHITIAGYSGIEEKTYPQLAEKIKRMPHIQAVSPFVQGQVLVQESERFLALSIRGIDPLVETQVSKVASYVKRGSVSGLQAANTVLIGKELAAYLGVDVDSQITAYSAQGKKYILKVAGVFHSGMYDYDLNLIFVNIKMGQEILGLPDKISAISVKLDNVYLADQVKNKLANTLGFEYTYKTWIEANQNFFAALKLEKLTMFIILTLIILVASFSIVSTLIVMVVEKTKDIGILKAVGMDAAGIRRIFTYLGLLIGTLGTILGFVGGIILCLLLSKYQFIKLPQDIYYIDKLPVSLVLWPDLVLVALSAMLITLVATFYPARKASTLKPVEALRYE